MIPSLALLMVFIPIIGTGFLPAFFALILHGIPTILISTYTGFRQVDSSVQESANAMGLTASEIFQKVEVPLAIPLIYSGLRTCTKILFFTRNCAGAAVSANVPAPKTRSLLFRWKVRRF
jgi:ABC-type proline/glycine betaine transport system permease subunit